MNKRINTIYKSKEVEGVLEQFRDQGLGATTDGPDTRPQTPDTRNEKCNKLIADLKGLQAAPDPYNAHKLADALLLAYIGDEEVRAAFDAIQKWYM